MKKKAEQLLAKAQDAIEAAELLLGGGKNTFAVGRAYYAMFYVAEALLYGEDGKGRGEGGKGERGRGKREDGFHPPISILQSPFSLSRRRATPKSTGGWARCWRPALSGAEGWALASTPN